MVRYKAFAVGGTIGGTEGGLFDAVGAPSGLSRMLIAKRTPVVVCCTYELNPALHTQGIIKRIRQIVNGQKKYFFSSELPLLT